MSIISVNNLTYYYDGCDEAVYENVSFTLNTTWKTGLIGRNGRGKTTLLKLLTGEFENGGAVNTKAEFLYFPFDVEDKNMTGSELIGIICPEVQEWEVIRELSYMGTDCEILYRPFSTLSGGEQTRLLLCLLFLHDNAFLLIDEPTNCLDLDAREAIGDYLKTKSGFILVSHDRDLLDKCTDHILSLNRSDTEIINGNYSVWKENFDRKEANEFMRDKKLKSEIGILYTSSQNETIIMKLIRQNDLKFEELFVAKPHVFISSKHPLADKEALTLEDLEEYPYLSFEQGDYNSFYFSEEILSTLDRNKNIKVRDRATLFNLAVGLDGYTVSSGVISKELNGENIIGKPLLVDEYMRIGTIVRKDVALSRYGKVYMEALKKYTGGM